MQISAVIITKNEERNIERCLKSLQDIVDEIIVVDSLSTDNTKSICEKYKVRFFEQEWLGYAEQKNYANSLSTHDILLSIDADEALSTELQQSILHLKSSQKENFTGQINRLTNYCGKWIHHCGWYPDRKIRIFDRNKAKWIGSIHETISYPNETAIIQLKGDLLHYSYHSIEDHIKQADRFTTFTAIEAFEKGKKATILSILIKPGWKFFRDYVFKRGFLDGYYGYVICKISAFATFLKYTKLKQLYRRHDTKS